MMNSIFIMEFIGLIIAIIIVYYLYKLWKIKSIKEINISIFILIILLFFIRLSNVLEYSNITKTLDIYEDYVELLIPLAWSFLFYIIIKDKRKKNLEYSKNLFKSIFNNDIVCMGVIDKNGNIIEANNKCLTMFNYNYSELINLNIINIIHPQYKEVIKRELENLINKKTNQVNLRHRAIKSDNNIFWINLNMTNINSLFKQKVIFIIKDISEEVLYEKELVEVEKMQTVTKIITGIAHDFNNKLTNIVLNADIISSQNNDLEKYVKHIIDSANSIKKLMTQLLFYVKKEKMEKKKTNIHNLLMNIIDIIKRSIKKDIIIKYEFKAENDIVDCNEQKIETALLNIIFNAEEAIKKGGVIKIVTENVNIKPNDTILKDLNKIISGNFIKIDIIDTGSGIPYNIRNKIFDPFFTTKENNMGTGMGLAVSKGIVEHHGGFVTFNSKIHKGSIFSVFLPVHNK